MKPNLALLVDGIKFIPAFRFNKGFTRLNFLHIDPTSNCNLRCKMCEARYKVDRRELPWSLYKKTVDEGKELGIKKILLASSGECLLHKDFSRMVNYAHDNNFDIELVTNLTSVKEDQFDALLKLTCLFVSIDGATKETYEKIRVGANFERTIENLKRIVENKGDTYIQVNYTIQKDNVAEIDKMFDLTASIGVDKVSFGLLHNEVDEVYDEVKLSREDLEVLKEQSKMVTKKLGGHDIQTNIDREWLEYLDKYGEVTLQGIQKHWIHEIPCYNLWFGTFINPNGIVLPCCNFYTNKYALGDLKTQSLKEIWHSKRYNELRRRFKGRKPRFCEGCPGDHRNFHKLLLKVPFHKFFLDI